MQNFIQKIHHQLMMPTPIFLILLLLPTTITSAPTRPFKAIFAFGDSFTDTGNTVSTTGPSGFNYVSSLPYGMTYFHHPTDRYSDGRLVIDFITQSLSLPFLPPFKNSQKSFSSGVNFAVAGSTAIPHDFFVKNNMSFDITPESLGTQLEWFDEFLGKYRGCGVGKKCEGVFDDALVWVGEIGVNDYAYSFMSSIPNTSIQNLALNSHSRFLEAILSKGAKYVVVQGLPPTGCLPLTLTLASDTDRDALGCVGSVNTLIRKHNAFIQVNLRRLRNQYPDTTIVYADYWDAYAAVMQNASHYGIKERFKTCCGTGGGPYNYVPLVACGAPDVTACRDPSEYVNWDGVHLTEAMYKVVSERIVHGPSCRPSFKYLLSKKEGRSG